MVEWDEILNWQAQVTDTIDRQEMEIRVCQSLEQMLLSQREHAIQYERVADLTIIDSHLAYLNLLVKLKALLIRNLKNQFTKGVNSLLA